MSNFLTPIQFKFDTSVLLATLS